MIDKLTNEKVFTLVQAGEYQTLLDLVRSEKISADEIITSPEGIGFRLTFVATQANNLSAVKALVQLGANVNRRSGGQTPLYVATSLGKIEMVKLLLESGADVNETSSSDEDSGKTPLMAATQYPDIVKLLLAAGANPKAVDSDGFTALFCENREVMQMLLGAGCPVTGECLHVPVYRRELDIVLQMLEQKPDVNKGFPYTGNLMKGDKPLIVAVEKNVEDIRKPPLRAQRLGIIKALLEAGADVNARGVSSLGMTPLLMAVEQKDAEIAGLLVQAGANPNEHIVIKTGRKTSALELARSRGLTDLIAAMQ